MKPKMSAAPTRKRVSKLGSLQPIRHMHAAMRKSIKQTAKRSVTRMRDKRPKRKKENELDLNTQLEKQTPHKTYPRPLNLSYDGSSFLEDLAGSGRVVGVVENSSSLTVHTVIFMTGYTQVCPPYVNHCTCAGAAE